MAEFSISETLLEMHYFRTLASHFESELGARPLQFFKPTTAAEHWYGFDEAYFTSNQPTATVIENLRDWIHRGSKPRFANFRAYLLQFKVVDMLQNRSTLCPAGWSTPYYRAELYLEPNKHTGISQHETLRRLSALAGASVAYVCPMIFQIDEVLETPDLSDLRFVDVSTSPNGWLTNKRHFIAFQQKTSAPTWCSEPVPAKILDWSVVVKRARPMQLSELQDLLGSIHAIVQGRGAGTHVQTTFFESKAASSYLPPSLLVVAERSR